jgi:hypothetical protein
VTLFDRWGHPFALNRTLSAERLFTNVVVGDATSKSQIRLDYTSTPCWAMVTQSCAWSGGQGKHLAVEGGFSDIRFPLDFVTYFVTFRRR